MIVAPRDTRVWRATWPVLAIPVLVALAYWPGLHGFWGRDDFMQLAFARLIGSPWPLFVQDHYFPGQGSFFRPLGFASFWIWQALFGTDYFAHAFADMLLHAAIGIALMRVMLAGNVDRMPALLCASLFALHPAVLGTALWWSARFDLLCTFFVLIALRAAFDYADRGRSRHLILTLLAALAALLSKETALTVVVAVTYVWLRSAQADNAHRAVTTSALGSLWVVTAILLAWRWAVIGTATTGLVGDASLPAALAKGIASWARHLPGYLTFWPRLNIVEQMVMTLLLIGLGAIIAIVFAKDRRRPRLARHTDLLICGLLLFLLPALLQAPVAAFNAAPLRSDASAVEAALQSRLYYLSMTGLFIMLCVCIDRAWRTDSKRLRATIAVVLGVGIAVLGWASRNSASDYARVSSAPAAIVREAVAVVERVALPPTRCHVFMFGVQPPPEWGAYVSMDSIVKALSPDLGRVGRCFVHSERVTYFHLMNRGVGVADAAPYRARRIDGNPLPWLNVGGAVAAYVDPPPDATPTALSGAVFLRYQSGRFHDVTVDVAMGRLPIALR